MSGRGEDGAMATIDAACRELKLPTVRSEASTIADGALRAGLTHRAYLADVLAAEVDDRRERRRQRRVADAKFPRIKRLAEFDCSRSPVNEATLAALAAGSFIEHGDPIVLLGDSGTGKSHLLIGNGMAAAEAGVRVRYTTAAALVNELVEAADDRALSRVIPRYGRIELRLPQAVALARDQDYSWAEIGDLLGTTRAAALQRVALQAEIINKRARRELLADRD